ncbi:MAG: amino acid ABC transporter substrate-binding protein [Rhodomicrobium sp.]|nr:MAG: amino acid ABC transporter substrate-binding protein [Rhodomicrobium sp.]
MLWRQLKLFASATTASLILSWAAGGSLAMAQTSELVDRSQLRVCADPSNLPFSNKKGEGFENKIAEIISEELDVPIKYTWFPQSIGFIRQTLDKKRCDIIIGYVATHELVLNSNPYYRTSYVLIHRDGELEGFKSLNDPRIKPMKIGVIAGTPPVSILAENKLLDNIKSFHRMVDRRYYSPAEEMIADISEGRLDIGLLWGPIGGYFAEKADKKLTVVPLIHETVGPRMSYRITFGVRRREKVWKRQLNRIIRRRQDDINKILVEYGVPLIDEAGELIKPAG